jgi:hypothetical protein
MRWLLVVCAGAAAAGCVNVSGTIAGELTRYGLDQNRAQCMGDRLARDLRPDQLRELAAAARAYGRDDPNPGRLTVADLVRVSGELRDAGVPIAVGRAAAGCGLRVSDVL